ncbi:DNA-3-methyladenine glycosylase [Glutamicibacter protophormiae]|uniref:DNA-3-methyladenine glycosylase n=1 Tax=Glutamicibacter protophormiae TaxID=37930 RepID=UPI001958B708|nr:DNA-3-methyladenine glycosylase [Glutamicibacter protophormiae]QRQ80051.1 DNA-3-methyladenine glycosylase [Glutamicibacter protophormiae]
MDREFFAADALEVAPRLLGAVLGLSSPEGTVRLRITEVEAYMGLGSGGRYDPGSHSKDRKTQRNASMFLGPGHAYVYFSYGMHFALNLVCSPAGIASGVLIRSGEIIDGRELARERRLRKRPPGTDPVTLLDRDLARGPGNLATALGINRPQHDGLDLLAAPFNVEERTRVPAAIASGPRVGVAGIAGGPQFPWRFWIPGNKSVSAFKPGRNAPRA